MIRPLHAVSLSAVLLAALWVSPIALLLDPSRASLHEPPSIVPAARFPLELNAGGHAARISFVRLDPLDPEREAVLVVAPERAYNDEEARALLGFLLAGGRVLVADDRGVGADLLARIGGGVELTSTHLYSPSFANDPKRLLARNAGRLPGLAADVELTWPVLVRGGDPVLLAPELSWQDLNQNGRPDLGEPLATGALASSAAVGRGELIVVGDPDVFLSGSNPARQPLLDYLAGPASRTLVLDEGHHGLRDPLGLNILTGGAERAAIRTGILITTIAVGAFVVLGPRLSPRPSRSRGRLGADPRVVAEMVEELDR